MTTIKELLAEIAHLSSALAAERAEKERLAGALRDAQRCFQRFPSHQSDYDKAEAIIDAALQEKQT